MIPRAAQLHVYRHRFLHMIWSGVPRFFACLPYVQQRVLHDYYRPADDLTDAQFLAHWHAVAKQPNGPQRAGKAYRQAERLYLQLTKAAAGDPVLFQQLIRNRTLYTYGPAVRERRIGVAGLARPVVDVRALARVLAKQALEIASQDGDKLIRTL